MKLNDLDVTVLTSDSAERSFLADLAKLDVKTSTVSYRSLAGYPDLAIEKVPKIIRSSDVVWLADEIYLTAPKIRRTSNDVPIVAHLRCWALICPWWGAMYGLRETCTRKCSISRIIRCKQLFNERLNEFGLMSKPRMRVFQLLDFVKGPVDFTRWPMSTDVIESIDGFVAPSEFARDLVMAHLPQLETVPVEVIHNPVFVPRISARKTAHTGPPRILYLGGESLIKGPHIAIHAARRLLDQGRTGFLLSMVNAEGQHWIQDLVSRLDLDEHVELLSRLDRTDVYRRMASSDLIIMPSIVPETFGRVPVEANRLGVPAVVSDLGALPDAVVDGVTGLVTKPSAMAFGEAVWNALSRQWDRDLIARVANSRFNAKKTVTDFIRFLSRFV
jgi:glycosyltransferase involved in cell wall biosynthesis